MTVRTPFVNCREVLFDWRQNVGEGIDSLEDKAGSARRYPNRLKRAQAFRDYLRDVINPQRLAAGLSPIRGFPVPPLSNEGLLGAEPPNQLLQDAVRGYNGFAGQRFGEVLHEFAPDVDFLLTLPDDQLRGLNRNPAFWERVPAGDRPQGTGEPTYVLEVIGRTATCGPNSICS